MNTPFAVRKIGHAVIFASDLERSTRFYTDVLGFKVSDTYDGSMMPGGMVFLRCNSDHHCLALVGEQGGRQRTRACTISPSSWRRSTRCSAPAIT